jgi:hypothetical protein
MQNKMTVKTAKLQLDRKYKTINILHENEAELREFADKVDDIRLDYSMDYGDFYFDPKSELWVAEFITEKKYCVAASQQIRDMISKEAA